MVINLLSFDVILKIQFFHLIVKILHLVKYFYVIQRIFK